MLGMIFGVFGMLSRVALGQSMKVLTAVLSVCNTPASITPDALQGVMVTNGDSVKNTFEYCTNNKVKFETYIYPQILSIPCPYSSAQCDTGGWADAVDNVLRGLGVDVDSYSNSVYVMPHGCSFGGLGIVGPCGSGMRCRVWINGDVSKQSSVYMHELAHNLGLNHAGYGGDPYGDWSDVMGYCCDRRCFNAAHMDDMKWGAAKATYDEAQLGVPISVTLGKNEYIKITANSRWTEYFIQFRAAEGLDTPPQNFKDNISIYSSSIGSTFSNLDYILRNSGDIYMGVIKVELKSFDSMKGVLSISLG